VGLAKENVVAKAEETEAERKIRERAGKGKAS